MLYCYNKIHNDSCVSSDSSELRSRIFFSEVREVREDSTRTGTPPSGDVFTTQLREAGSVGDGRASLTVTDKASTGGRPSVMSSDAGAEMVDMPLGMARCLFERGLDLGLYYYCYYYYYCCCCCCCWWQPRICPCFLLTTMYEALCFTRFLRVERVVALHFGVFCEQTCMQKVNIYQRVLNIQHEHTS